MGMYDTFFNADESIAVQTKVGPNLMQEYRLGDPVDREFFDAVIVGHEGCVVIRNHRVVDVTETFPKEHGDLPVITKWGTPFNPLTQDLDDFHPLREILP